MQHRKQLVVIQHSKKPELSTLTDPCDIGDMTEELNLFVLRAARSVAVQDGSIVKHLLAQTVAFLGIHNSWCVKNLDPSKTNTLLQKSGKPSS